MKKAILGLAAAGAVVAVRPVVKRVVPKMHERCEQMMAQLAQRGEAAART